METLLSFLRRHAKGDLLSWEGQREAACAFGLSPGQVEEAALAANLLPARYQRNRKMLTLEQQRRLFGARVAVIGCGGLGGYLIEELARLGVGTLHAIDPDIFEEHNLNRQLLSSPALLGRAKVETAAERIAQINPAVTAIPVREALGRENGRRLLAKVDLVLDALDSVPVRLELAEICRDLQIPLVHGAIAGWYGQVLTQFPGENHLENLYRRGSEVAGLEKTLGNPSFTPAVVASLQAAEACKILAGTGEPLRNRQLVIDLYRMEMDVVHF